MAPTYFIRNSAQVSEWLLLCTELWVGSISRLVTVLDRESPPKLESTDLLLVLISLFWELLLLCRFLSFWNIFHHSLIQRRPLQNRTLFYHLQRFQTAVCTDSFLSFRHGQFLSEKQGTSPPSAIRVRHPLPGQPEPRQRPPFWILFSKQSLLNKRSKAGEWDDLIYIFWKWLYFLWIVQTWDQSGCYYSNLEE